MKTKNIATAISIVLCLQAVGASATEVEVNIQNLSNQVIRTSKPGFPALLMPGQQQSVFFNFFDTGSDIDVTYTSASGKTCSFQGGHKLYGEYQVKREKEAIGTASYCGANLNVKRWLRPYDYRLGFWMTE